MKTKTAYRVLMHKTINGRMVYYYTYVLAYNPTHATRLSMIKDGIESFAVLAENALQLSCGLKEVNNYNQKAHNE